MKIETNYYNKINSEKSEETSLVFYCFDRMNTKLNEVYKTLSSKFVNAQIVGLSTSGHYIDETINDDEIVYSALTLEKSQILANSFNIKDFDNSKALGEKIGSEYSKIPKIKGICLISDGSLVNGTELINGVTSFVDSSISIFGGMAGDQARFEKTLTGLNQTPSEGNVIAIGFIGDEIEIKTACEDGWTSTGMEYKITESKGNLLSSIDGKNAYDILYNLLEPKDNEEFTRNTLYYPFLLEDIDKSSVIRTPIIVDHKSKTLTYAGDMPEGSKITLMKSNTLELLDSTLKASEKTKNNATESFLLATSCVGRRVVLGEMASEEYDEMKNFYDGKINVLGFYSYGEFARINDVHRNCKLHNQTFTLASITEK